MPAARCSPAPPPPAAVPSAVAASPSSSMRRAPKRAITPPAAMPPTMPSTENTAVSEPTAAKSNPMSRRNSGAAMTLPTCNAATTPAPTMASTAAQRVPAGVPPCPSPVRRMPCSVSRAGRPGLVLVHRRLLCPRIEAASMPVRGDPVK